jgi:NADH:ubiquinone oxidoreductase subunit 3 (subunit A)
VFCNVGRLKNLERPLDAAFVLDRLLFVLKDVRPIYLLPMAAAAMVH